MARLLALCSLPRTNQGDRLQYVRRNGPYTLVMTATGLHRDRWREHGHQQSFLFRQALRGRRSGLVRRAGSLTERQPWADLGVSRATWYRRFHGVH